MINKNSNLYFILFFTAVIFSFVAILYFTHNKLEQKIENQKQQELQQALKQALMCNDILEKSLDNKIFFYCKKNPNLIAIHLFATQGYAGSIEYVASFDLNNYINQVIILNHKETPGLGDKITNKNWLNSLINKTPAQLRIKPDGGQIDSFSAASITPRALLSDSQENLIWVINHKENIISLQEYN